MRHVKQQSFSCWHLNVFHSKCFSIHPQGEDKQKSAQNVFVSVYRPISLPLPHRYYVMYRSNRAVWFDCLMKRVAK